MIPGSGLDAKSALYYNTSYLSKNPVSLADALPLFQNAGSSYM